MYWDWTYLLLIPGIILAIAAQSAVHSAFAKYSRINGKNGYRADDIAREILRNTDVQNVPVEQVAGALTDHYDPRSRTLRLSQGVYGATSIAALAIAAHEAGHAIQHARNYFPLKIRNFLAPISQLASWVAPILIIAGFIFQMTGLIHVGIYFFAAAVFFTVITLPVEFDASYMALLIIRQRKYLEGEELIGAKKVLRAAALTYVASTLMAVLQLLRFVLLARGRD